MKCTPLSGPSVQFLNNQGLPVFFILTSQASLIPLFSTPSFGGMCRMFAFYVLQDVSHYLPYPRSFGVIWLGPYLLESYGVVFFFRCLFDQSFAFFLTRSPTPVFFLFFPRLRNSSGLFPALFFDPLANCGAFLCHTLLVLQFSRLPFFRLLFSGKSLPPLSCLLFSFAPSF